MVGKLSIKNFGPIRDGDFRFGALNVFTGPQASGKSLVLQLIKLLLDTGAVQETLERYGVVWRNSEEFIERMFGEGMHTIWSKETEVAIDGKKVDPSRLARKGNRNVEESVFYIPAQRVLAVNPQSGWFRGFFDYRVGDPFVLRDFSEKLRVLGDQEAEGVSNNSVSGNGLPNVRTIDLFPQKKRLKKESRESLAHSIFGDYHLAIEVSSGQRRLVLRRKQGPSLPFTTWSAGQREFVPLLLGAYHLLPSAATTQRRSFRVVIIEEIEMGLHPRGISSAMLLVLELLQRGYQIFLSTHSARVLDHIWAFLRFRELAAKPEYVLKLFDLPGGRLSQSLASAVLDSSKHMYTYFFERESGKVFDISTLDPGSEERIVAEWGELVGIAGRAAELVAEAVAQSEIAAPDTMREESSDKD